MIVLQNKLTTKYDFFFCPKHNYKRVDAERGLKTSGVFQLLDLSDTHYADLKPWPFKQKHLGSTLKTQNTKIKLSFSVDDIFETIPECSEK